jgi:hypothetical protein
MDNLQRSLHHQPFSRRCNTQGKHKHHTRRSLRKSWPLLIAIIQVLAVASSAITAVIPPSMFGFTYIGGEPKVAYAAGTITGQVFNDYDSDGTKNPVEATSGVAGVLVTAYDINNNVVATATTDISGAYSLDTGATSGPYRVEFTNLPEGMHSSAVGANSGTTVQVVENGGVSGVDLGVLYPIDYCQNNPDVCVPIAVNGDRTEGDPESQEGKGTAPNLNWGIVRFPEDARREEFERIEPVAERIDVGSTWGLAYNRATKTLYAAAFLKRHVSLGPEGLGAIYQISNANTDTPGLTSIFFNVSDVGDDGTTFSDDTRGLAGIAPDFPNIDAGVVEFIGTVGLGDIDISDDMSTLYVVNLYERTLLAISTDNSPSLQDEYDIPTDECIDGEARPFATKYYRGNVYVGVICDAMYSQDQDDLKAIVYRIAPSDSSSEFEKVLEFSLDFQRGQAHQDDVQDCSPTGHPSRFWHPWTNSINYDDLIHCNYHVAMPQPLLSDIEFDIDGSMILGFMDRYGVQSGYDNDYPNGDDGERGLAIGDLLRVYYNRATGEFELEHDGVAGPLVGLRNEDAPSPEFENNGPGGGEFYYGDWYDNHYEITQGGLALRYGSGNVISTVFDPMEIFSGGVRYFNNTTGYSDEDESFLVFRDQEFDSVFFGKGSGLGDLELLCDLAPLQIGNYVWLDADGDGIQDPDEPPLANVVVELYDEAGNLIATTTTNSNGLYYFSNNSNPDQSWEQGYESVQPNTAYEIRIALDQPPLTGLAPTQLDYDADAANSNAHDSDGNSSLRDGYVTVELTTGGPGNNNHTYDFGFVGVVTVGDYVWYDNNLNGQQDDGEEGVSGVTVTIYDATTNQPVLVNGQPYTDVTDDDGRYLFTDLPPGDYYVVFDLTTLPDGYVPTTPNQGNDATDSDADPATGRTPATGFLFSGDEDLTLDLGIIPAVTVGDYVWYDNNNNGQQDDGEEGVPGVAVTIYDATTNEPVLVDGQPYTDVTDDDGRYLFENLPPGDYYVVFDLTTLPDGYKPVTPNQGNDDARDSDADPTTGRTPSTGFIPSGGQNLTLDLGIVAPVTVGDYVWYDNNNNGQQDDGEPGVPGVTVTIYDATTDQPVLVDGQPYTDVTDAEGYYLFEDLPPGDYYVVFDLTTLPDGYVPTTPNQGDDTRDSDADPVTGRTPPTGFIPSGGQNLTLDLGIYAPVPLPVTVGDYVWIDNNGNGQQDDGEPGVPGVTVTIYDATTNQPVLVDGQPYQVVTDDDGRYLFTDLPPGDYYVVFDLTTLPEGYVPTTPNQGNDDARDSDADPTTGRTPPTGFIPSGGQNLTLDLGIRLPPTAEAPVPQPHAPSVIFLPHLGH